MEQNDFKNLDNQKLTKNYGGPLHYLGNRFLTLPDLTGHMTVDHTWLHEIFSVVLANHKGPKYQRCIEPFAGSASWSLAAMELGLAEEYIINESDKALIGTHQLIKNQPDAVKEQYRALVQNYQKASSKKEFFLAVIADYNKAADQQKSLLLPFIVNHSWGGMLFHNAEGQIIYHENTIDGKLIPGYLEQANLTLEMFLAEIDRISSLLNTNKVTFQSGDFIQVLSDIQSADFVALNPPYPENKRSLTDGAGMYTELYRPDTLHINLTAAIEQMEEKKIDYFLTYGFYDPKMKEYVLKDNNNQPRNYFLVLGYDGCAFGTALDQIYFNSKFTMPKKLASKIILATEVLRGIELSPTAAISEFIRLSHTKKSSPKTESTL